MGGVNSSLRPLRKWSNRGWSASAVTFDDTLTINQRFFGAARKRGSLWLSREAMDYLGSFRRFLELVAISLAWVLIGSTALAEVDVANPSINLVAFEFGALSHSENGKAAGPAIEIVDQLVAATEIRDRNVNLVPLVRILQMLNDGHTIAAFVGRRPEREGKMRWVVNLFNDQLVFVTYHQTAVNSLAEARHLGNVGATRGGYPLQFLQSAGLKNIEIESAENVTAKMLINGRIDAWITASRLIKGEVESHDVSVNALTIGASIADLNFWVAASLDVPDRMIVEMANRFAAMKADGSYDRIMKVPN